MGRPVLVLSKYKVWAAPFWSDNGKSLCPFWCGVGYGYEGTTVVYERILSFQFQINKKERVIRAFKWILRNLST